MSDLTIKEAREFMRQWGKGTVRLKRWDGEDCRISLSALFELLKVLLRDELEYSE